MGFSELEWSAVDYTFAWLDIVYTKDHVAFGYLAICSHSGWEDR